ALDMGAIPILFSEVTAGTKEQADSAARTAGNLYASCNRLDLRANARAEKGHAPESNVPPGRIMARQIELPDISLQVAPINGVHQSVVIGYGNRRNIHQPVPARITACRWHQAGNNLSRFDIS